MYYIIYETINKINGKLYRGCHKTDNLNDGYLGSGVLFIEALKKYGKENFERNIICECKSLEDMIEKEAFYIDEEWVEREDTYNLQTGGLSYGILSEESKEKISKSLIKAHSENKFDYSKRIYGDPWNKGLVNPYEEKTIESIRNSLKGKEPWNKGKTGLQKAWNKNITGIKMKPRSDEAKKAISEALKKKYSESEHHMKGKEPWNKGKTGLQKAWNKEKALELWECPHCNKTGRGISNKNRWHFDNCRSINLVTKQEIL